MGVGNCARISYVPLRIFVEVLGRFPWSRLGTAKMLVAGNAALAFVRPVAPAVARPSHRHQPPQALFESSLSSTLEAARALASSASMWLPDAVSPLAPVAAAALFVGSAASVVSKSEKPESVGPVQYGVDVPYKEAQYDPDAADAFFRARPIASLRRLLQLTQLSGGFILLTLIDKRFGREEAMTDRRSEQLLELVTKLGPTFIKVCSA